MLEAAPDGGGGKAGKMLVPRREDADDEESEASDDDDDDDDEVTCRYLFPEPPRFCTSNSWVTVSCTRDCSGCVQLCEWLLCRL